MNYEGQICRAPMERSSFMLPVTVGCPYNQCKFCNLFRHLRYRELPAEKIEEELKRVKDVVDGQQVEIPVPCVNRTVGTQRESLSLEWKNRCKRGISCTGKSVQQ